MGNSKLTCGILLFLIASITFGAILESTVHGKLVVDILSIDKEGVTFKGKLGASLLKAENVKYVLLDEKRTDLIGKKGIHLTDGTIIYGEPVNISKDSGLVNHPHGVISLKLSDIVYFSYDNYESHIEIKMNELSRSRFSRSRLALDESSEKVKIQLASGSTILTDTVNIQQTTDGKITFQFTSNNINYLVSSGYIELIEIPRRHASKTKFIVETADGSILLGNITFGGNLLLVTTAFDDKLTVPIDQMVFFTLASNVTPTTRTYDQYIRIGQFQGQRADYDGSTGTLTIYVVGTSMIFDGKQVSTLEIPVGK